VDNQEKEISTLMTLIWQIKADDFSRFLLE
jgi:hypothetical protein